MHYSWVPHSLNRPLVNLFLGNAKVFLKFILLNYTERYLTGWHKSFITLVWYRMTQKFNHTYLVQTDTKVLFYLFGTSWHESFIILVWYRMIQKSYYTCLVQDDTKVLMAKHDVQMMLETTQKQQQQFSDIPDQLPLDPNIPITFTKVKSCTFMPSCFLNR